MSWHIKLPFLAPKPDLDAELASFTDEAGKTRVLDTLCQNRAVDNKRPVAKQILEGGDIVAFAKGDTLITEGGSEASVFFLISGEVDVLKGSTKITARRSANQVGEMAARQPGNKRTATVKARTDVVVAVELSGNKFRELDKGKFKDAITSELQVRQTEHLAYRAAKENYSRYWWVASAITAVVIGCMAFTLASHYGLTGLSKTVAWVSAALVAFVGFALLNPAFILKRTAVAVVFAILALAVADWQLHFSYSIGSTVHELHLLSASEAEGPWQSLAAYAFLFLTFVVLVVADLRQNDHL